MTMWPRLVGGLWREVNYTVTRLMHSECGRIFRGAVGEGGLTRGGPLYTIDKQWHGGKTAWKYTPAFGL